MELMTYKTRAVRTLSLLILVAMLAALTPPSITGSSALAQTATTPEITSFSADTANQVSLTWSAVTDADNYQVWRWESAENWVELDGSFEGTTYTDTGVTAGKTYYYQVSADGGTTWSNRVSATVGAYDASTLSIGTVTSSMVPVSWGAVTGATSYELWRYENSWTQIGGTITGTSHDDTSVEIGKTYYYQVMAKGPAGDGAWSNRASATVPSTTPGMPLNLNAAAGDAQVVLTWDVPATDGGSALTGYQYRYQMAGGSWSSWMATSPALSRTATVSSLTNETAHNFEVQAMNANGASPSATASATPMSTPPGIPSGLGTTSTGPTEITLSWTAAAGAASYQLQRRTNGGSWGSPMDAGSGTTYTDTGLMPSTTYDYEVRAVNPAGNSDWSAVVTAATTAPTAPDATTLTATAGASNIMLSLDRARQQRRRPQRLRYRRLRRRRGLERSRHQGRRRHLARPYEPWPRNDELLSHPRHELRRLQRLVRLCNGDRARCRARQAHALRNRQWDHDHAQLGCPRRHRWRGHHPLHDSGLQ